MKRALTLLVLVLVAGSCKDEDMFGSIVIPINDGAEVNGVPLIGQQVGLYDVSSNLGTGDILMVTKFTASGAEFKEVNPGNYKVAILIAPGGYRSVQVKAGKEVTVNMF